MAQYTVVLQEQDDNFEVIHEVAEADSPQSAIDLAYRELAQDEDEASYRKYMRVIYVFAGEPVLMPEEG